MTESQNTHMVRLDLNIAMSITFTKGDNARLGSREATGLTIKKFQESKMFTVLKSLVS